MTSDEFELQKLRIEADTRRYEARLGLRKIVAGTMVVGLAAAAFPFLQKTAELFFEGRIEQQRLLRSDEQALRTFLGSVGTKGQSPDVNERLILADFYYFLTPDGPQKENWRAFRTHLLKQIASIKKAEEELIRLQENTRASSTDVTIARQNVETLREQNLLSPSRFGIQQSCEQILPLLLSDDRSTRANARTQLSNLGVPMVPCALDKLAEPNNPYRTTLGLVVALTEMMRANKASRRLVSAELSDEDLSTLMPLAGHSDRTIRIYASEFLYDLGDPRSFDIAVDEFGRIADANGRYNLALVMKGAAPFLEPTMAESARQKLARLREQVGPNTRTLVDEALELLPSPV